MDPIGFAAGDANLYRYVGNGPTGATDSLGLADKELARQAANAALAGWGDTLWGMAKKTCLGPSDQTAPIMSGKTAPLGPADVVLAARRARVAQLGTRLKARSEGLPGVVA